jgi:hypothetical protein
MTDAAATADARRAEQARADLLRDIREIKKMGDHMIEKTETAIHNAPVLLGLGAVGIALIGVAVIASRRTTPRFPGLHRERSFFAEAARGAALSALGILSGRLTQRLLTAALAEPTEST